MPDNAALESLRASVYSAEVTGESLALQTVEERRELAKRLASLSTDQTLASEIARETGLSIENARYGLLTSLPMKSEVEGAFFPRVVDQRPTLVVLAGNVFGAVIRALVVPLLCGSPVIARTSSRNRALPLALRACLPAPFRDALSIVEENIESFDRAGLLARMRSVHVYGANETIESLRELVPPSVLFVPHGHGYAVGVFDPAAGDVQDAAEGLARDIAAYDQRGCFSPQLTYVVGDVDQADELAEALHRALAKIEIELPRGLLDEAQRVQQKRLSEIGAALGRVMKGPTHLILRTEETVTLGASGLRSQLISPCSPDRIRTLLEGHGESLKLIVHNREDPRAWMPRRFSPRACSFGLAQRPPLLAPQDGWPYWHGLLTG